MADLPIPELVENRRRSVAMLSPGAPALSREEALEVLAQLEAALVELRKLSSQGETREPQSRVTSATWTVPRADLFAAAN